MLVIEEGRERGEWERRRRAGERRVGGEKDVPRP